MDPSDRAGGTRLADWTALPPAVGGDTPPDTPPAQSTPAEALPHAVGARRGSPVEKRLVDGLAERGWSVERNFLPRDLTAALRDRARRLDSARRMRPATIGTGRLFRPEVRGDRVMWLGSEPECAAERDFLSRVDSLRLAINAGLLLGAFEYEGHFAVFPPGAGYGRHLDQPRGSAERIVSCIAYLNDSWAGDDGGQLRIYSPDEPNGFVDVAPEGGCLAIFLSAEFEHEVLPARRERYSVTGWLRRRPRLKPGPQPFSR